MFVLFVIIKIITSNSRDDYNTDSDSNNNTNINYDNNNTTVDFDLPSDYADSTFEKTLKDIEKVKLYVAVMLFNGIYWCGGALVTRMHIVIPAHCLFFDNNNKYNDLFGDFKWKNITFYVPVTNKTYDVKSFEAHDWYNKTTVLSAYDVAIVRTSKKIGYLPEMKQLMVPTDFDPDEDKDLQLILTIFSKEMTKYVIIANN